MTVLRKMVGMAPETLDIDSSLESLKDAVGGWIEKINVTATGDVVALVDEEGLLKELPDNVSLRTCAGEIPIVGTVVLCGVEDGEFCSLRKPELASKYLMAE